ncbi:protein kinase domain-containing protein [Mycolicibacterium holsaticum]|uniref:protein kinase domain-containing protein n=1 Tax=Mycolicibacterium holsaticum TaxID=152142 RepID=UPI0009FB971C|nr:protein kinase [Mycolicibacterium holsaticum]
MSLRANQKFAGYTIVRRLGAGGMGEVYLAEHPRLPRRDALKLLTGDITADPNFRERFLRESDLASTLWHPHIVGVHDRGEWNRRLWLSMDFVDGEDAASLIARKYPAGMPVEPAMAIVTAVASALDYAHNKGLLHRDVKPSNVLITHEEGDEDRRTLLTDFGIARAVDDSSGLTDTNMTVGTVDYAAPEQLMGSGMDGRADQYSLAATAYHLLTGLPPFRDSNAAIVIGRHLNADPPSLGALRPELAPLDDVLAAGLAKDPNDRFASCSDFARALSEQASASTRGSWPAAPTTPAPVQRPAKAPQRQHAGSLAPGWYPDPGGGGRALYWDGQVWHTAPTPNLDEPRTDETRDFRKSRSGLWLALTAIALVTALAVVGLVFYASRDAVPSEPTASPTSDYPEPTFSPETSPPLPTATTPRSMEPPAPTATVTVTSPQPPPPTRVPYWTAMIVGTCDEGDSCGVKQRNAPYVDAGPLYPSSLKDGMTVRVVCYTTGEAQANSGHGTSYYWYRLANGAYVSLVYTDLKAPVGMPTC